ncbi:non-structural maintenance of chromosomes element 4 homolog A-like [Aristolochia californica]|uniref:non-structural maintenance of chromosomes element 4 homolog A-like n=1 Tax=Aristolochia californica TaxID=171875 RepID=UPI0035DEB6E1
MSKVAKREPGAARRSRAGVGQSSGSEVQGVAERRVLRSRYLAMKHLIQDEREDISKADSDMFHSIISEVETLHQQVQKPREQVADAEALLDIANTLVQSVKLQGNEGVTPSEFVISILKNFGQHNGPLNVENNSVSWKDIGLAVSHIFKRSRGCCTMLGPMNSEVKQRKVAVRRTRAESIKSTRPEEIVDAAEEEHTDTDKNIATMFDILRRKRCVRFEHLVLNRICFAQTVENIFALSFLVKDGRVEIKVNDQGHHLVIPRNAPSAAAIASGEAKYSHFALKFGFNDWKLMADSVSAEEEQMPHRDYSNIFGSSLVGPSSSNAVSAEEEQMPHRDYSNIFGSSLVGPSSSNAEAVEAFSKAAGIATPIRKLTRNRGLVLQDQSVVEETPEKSDSPGLKRKRRLFP